MSRLVSVNVGRAAANPWKQDVRTGIDKVPQTSPVAVRDPGAGGSGLVGDYIGDAAHHGGSDQAVYAFAREDLDAWEGRLGRPLRSGFFGENLTTLGVDVNGARLGERWRVGPTVDLVVRSPRVPCSTFRGWVDETAWLKTFTLDARPGAYLEVCRPGTVRAGDVVRVLAPGAGPTVSEAFRIYMGQTQ